VNVPPRILTVTDEELDERIEQIASRVTAILREFLHEEPGRSAMQRFLGPAHWRYESRAYEQTILQPVEDLLGRASKKWRPVFAILMLEMLGEDPGPYERAIALMLELIHTGALIIDDIEDQSALRRGDTCIHLRYGTDVAINAANFLYFVPLLELQQHEHLADDQKLLIHERITHFFLRGHLGQATDIWRSHFINDFLVDDESSCLDERVLQTYADKTASAVEAAVDIVGVITRMDEGTKLPEFKRFARSVGVAFQILDDVKNFSTSSEWTKTVAEDLATGKPTYVICRAIRLLPPDQSKLIKTLLSDPAKRAEEKRLADGVELVRRSGALQSCESEARKMFQESWQCLCKVVPDSIARRCMYRLCQRVYADLHSV